MKEIFCRERALSGCFSMDVANNHYFRPPGSMPKLLDSPIQGMGIFPLVLP